MSRTMTEPPAVSDAPRAEPPKSASVSLSESERERFAVVSSAVRGVYELSQYHQEERVRDVAAVLRSVVDQIRMLDEAWKAAGAPLAESERDRFAMVSSAIRGVYELSQHHQEERVRDVAAVLRSVVDQIRMLDESLGAKMGRTSRGSEKR